MDQKRMMKQVSFIAETDQLKGIERKTKPIGSTRRENSAEHSWQVLLSAMILAEYADEEIDLLRVLKMLAVHDVVEIEVGDTFHYAKDEKEDLEELETEAAERIFSILPEDQRDEYMALWREFETKESSEACFAASVDRLMAFILNSRNNGGTWKEFSISAKQVLEKNEHIKEGAQALWSYAQSVVESHLSEEEI